MLTTMHPILNDHEYYMRPACVIHAVWRHFILVPSTSFSQVPWSVLWLRHQFVTDLTAWLINPNLSCSKNRKLKENKTKNKIQGKEEIKTKSTVNDLDNLYLFMYRSAPCISSPSNSLSRLLVIPYLRNCFYNISLVIPNTTIFLVTVLTIVIRNMITVT